MHYISVTKNNTCEIIEKTLRSVYVLEILERSVVYDMIYLLTAIGLSPGGRSTVHIYTQTVHRTTKQFWKSAGRALSWLVVLWHLPYNRGKSTEKPQSG